MTSSGPGTFAFNAEAGQAYTPQDVALISSYAYSPNPQLQAAYGPSARAVLAALVPTGTGGGYVPGTLTPAAAAALNVPAPHAAQAPGLSRAAIVALVSAGLVVLLLRGVKS